MTPDHVQLAGELVRAEAGVTLPPEKDYLVKMRLERLASELGIDSIEALWDSLRQGDAVSRSLIVDALVATDTSFFRDVFPFRLVSGELLDGWRARHGSEQPLRIWSAGCASGQEAYSIRMALEARRAELGELELWATDRSQALLERAQAGWYSVVEVNRGLTARQVDEHFTPERNGFRIATHYRDEIRFQLLNLLEPFTDLPVFDAIFLRNVLGSLEPDRAANVLDRVRQVLAPDGALFLGCDESPVGLDDFERKGIGRASVYHHRDSRPPSPPSGSRTWAG